MSRSSKGLAPTTLATLFQDPYDPLDTSGGNRRLHAYRRIILAAHALQYDLQQLTHAALFALNWPSDDAGKPARSIDDLTLAQVEEVADSLEQMLDYRTYG